MENQTQFHLAVARVEVFADRLNEINPHFWPTSKEFRTYLVAVKQMLTEAEKNEIVCVLCVKKIVIRCTPFNMIIRCFTDDKTIKIVGDHSYVLANPKMIISAKEIDRKLPVAMMTFDAPVMKNVSFVKKDMLDSLLFFIKQRRLSKRRH